MGSAACHIEILIDINAPRNASAIYPFDPHNDLGNKTSTHRPLHTTIWRAVSLKFVFKGNDQPDNVRLYVQNTCLRFSTSSSDTIE